MLTATFSNGTHKVGVGGWGSIMMWTGISHILKMELVILGGTLTGQRYIDQVINPHVVPLMQRNGGRFTFMDNIEPES